MKAVIDLGSNTFHLLIVQCLNGVQTTFYRERIFVRLLEDVTSNQIHPKAFDRARAASQKIFNKLQELNISNFRVIGTAGLRDTNNGNELKTELESIFNAPIQILTDQEEAKYIFRGVQPSIPSDEEPYLIMDIGGGSIEFIVVADSKAVRIESFPIGLHKLSEMIDYNGILTNQMYESVKNVCEEKLIELVKFIQNAEVQTLVGNAGSFEICNNIASLEPLNTLSYVLNIEKLKRYFKEIKEMSESELILMDWIPRNRIRMMPLAFGLIDIVIDMFNISRLLYSPCSVKEGVLQDI